MTASTTQKVSIASGVSQASTGTSGDPSLLQMLANVSELVVTGENRLICTKEMTLHPSFAGSMKTGHEILRQLIHTLQLISLIRGKNFLSVRYSSTIFIKAIPFLTHHEIKLFPIAPHFENKMTKREKRLMKRKIHLRLS